MRNCRTPIALTFTYAKTCSSKGYRPKICAKSVQIQRTKKSSGGDKENKLNEVYGNKYRISFDHEILRDHGLFYPRALADELVYNITLAPANMVLKGSDPTKLDYELSNIQLKYETLHEHDEDDKSVTFLARDVESTYPIGKIFMYEDIKH